MRALCSYVQSRAHSRAARKGISGAEVDSDAGVREARFNLRFAVAKPTLAHRGADALRCAVAERLLAVVRKTAWPAGETMSPLSS